MLQGSPGSRLRQLLSHRFDWHVLTFPNEPPEKRKKKVFILILTLHARHIPKWLFLVHFSFFSLSYLISNLLLSLSLLPSTPPSRLCFFFSLPPLDQCPLCHQEMYKPSLSTPPRCVLPGVPRALSLSMESTRDIR